MRLKVMVKVISDTKKVMVKVMRGKGFAWYKKGYGKGYPWYKKGYGLRLCVVKVMRDTKKAMVKVIRLLSLVHSAGAQSVVRFGKERLGVAFVPREESLLTDIGRSLQSISVFMAGISVRWKDLQLN